MKYLQLGAVKKENPNIQFPLSEAEKVEFLETCKSIFPNATEKELTHFVGVCSSSKALIFASWVETDSNLFSTLQKGEFSDLFKDSLKLKEHALYEEFKLFLEPFLFSIYTNKISSISEKNSHFFASYSILLPAYQQNLVQDSISEWVLSQKEELSIALKKAKKDTDLHKLVAAYLSENRILTLDSLNLNHYRIKTQLLEFFMGLTFHPKSSSRFLLFLSQRLLQLQLTDEHRKQVTEFGSNVKKGKIVVESSRISWLRLSGIILLLLICVVGIIALFYVKEDPENDLAQEQTAYMAFSKEERQKLDSLITEVKSEKRLVDDARLDSNLPFVGEDLVEKRTWTNALFRDLINHWAHNDSVPFTKLFTQSKPFSSTYPQTKPLSKKGGNAKVEFHNETDLMALVVVFQNSKNGLIYTKYVHSKSLAKWTMNEGDYLFVLPGNKVPSNMKFGNLPFKELDQHFYENLGISYRVDAFQGKKIKLIWENLGNNNSYLMDLSNALIKE
ncbi:hypothetical protein [Fluviicola taffensis]|uniref:Uncharacterized protein n=1 Tax=Fluviicola taffensis (strain DSM 16823 / NCIMB 13979 / RW262) TaxID=755732 RepID=F2IFW7_FLUTR|nr:hypothetical protein [Fluviicola taffensis]AEA43588.1 hypothetical protein Fluta_1596 [Fluviicola taffensis DSM 16823]